MAVNANGTTEDAAVDLGVAKGNAIDGIAGGGAPRWCHAPRPGRLAGAGNATSVNVAAFDDPIFRATRSRRRTGNIKWDGPAPVHSQSAAMTSRWGSPLSASLPRRTSSRSRRSGR